MELQIAPWQQHCPLLSAAAFSGLCHIPLMLHPTLEILVRVQVERALPPEGLSMEIILQDLLEDENTFESNKHTHTHDVSSTNPRIIHCSSALSTCYSLVFLY